MGFVELRLWGAGGGRRDTALLEWRTREGPTSAPWKFWALGGWGALAHDPSRAHR